MTTEELLLKISGDASGAVTAAQDVSTSVDGMGASVKATMIAFVSAEAILEATKETFRTLKEFVGDSIAAYANAETAAKKMTAALQAQGTATPGTIREFNDLATQVQRTTVYSDDLTNQMEALLTEVGNVAPAQMGKALQASADLASGLGIDLQNATMLVAKAFASGGESLGRLKAVLGDAYRPGMDMADVLGVIEQKFGGQASAEADTYAGRIKQITNEWDNFKEAVGKAVVTDPQLVALLDVIQKRITGIGESADQYEPTITDWWAAVAGLAGGSLGGNTIGSAAIGYLNSVDKAVQDINRDIGKLPAPPREFTDFPKTMAQAFPDLTRSAKEMFDATVDGWKKDADAAKKYQDAVDAAYKKWSGADAAEQMKILDAVFRKLADSGQITQQQLEGIVAEAVKLAQGGATLTPRLWDVVNATGALNPNVVDGIDNFKNLGQTISSVTIPATVLLQGVIDGLNEKIIPFGEGLSKIGTKADDGFGKAVQDAQAFQKGLEDMERAELAAMASIAQGLQTISSAIGGQAGQVLGSLSGLVNNLKLAREQNDQWGGSAGVASGLFSDESSATEKWASAVQSSAAIASGAMAVWTSTTNAGSKAVGAFKGAISGAEAGAAFGPWGAAIGAAAGALVGFIRNINAGRDAVVNFANSQGGFDVLHDKLDALGASGEALWVKLTQGVDKADPAAAKAVIDEITKALGDQKQAEDALLQSQNQQLGDLLKGLDGLGAGDLLQPYLDKLADAKGLTGDNLALIKQLGGDGSVSFDQMQKAASALGISTDKLGQSFQNAKAQADWQSIIDNLDTLVRGGANLNDLLGDEGLQKKIQDLVSSSLQFGTTIPENAKPWVQSLIDQGKLLDASGNKITDINKLNFGESLQTSMQKLIDKIGLLIDNISGVKDAIDKVPNEKDINFVGKKSGDWPTGDSGDGGDTVGAAATGAFVTAAGLVPLGFGLGGFVPRGTDTVPAMLTPGELVLNASQQGRLASMLAGGGDGGLTVNFHEGAIDASGSMFTDTSGMRKLASVIGDEIARRYKQSYRVSTR